MLRRRVVRELRVGLISLLLPFLELLVLALVMCAGTATITKWVLLSCSSLRAWRTVLLLLLMRAQVAWVPIVRSKALLLLLLVVLVVLLLLLEVELQLCVGWTTIRIVAIAVELMRERHVAVVAWRRVDFAALHHLQHLVED